MEFSLSVNGIAKKWACSNYFTGHGKGEISGYQIFQMSLFTFSPQLRSSYGNTVYCTYGRTPLIVLHITLLNRNSSTSPRTPYHTVSSLAMKVKSPLGPGLRSFTTLSFPHRTPPSIAINNTSITDAALLQTSLRGTGDPGGGKRGHRENR